KRLRFVFIKDIEGLIRHALEPRRAKPRRRARPADSELAEEATPPRRTGERSGRRERARSTTNGDARDRPVRDESTRGERAGRGAKDGGRARRGEPSRANASARRSEPERRGGSGRRDDA